MFWLPLLTTLLGAGSGAAGNAAKQRQKQQSANLRAAEIEASPWTGNAPSTQVQYAPPAAGDILGGAISGFSTGQSLNKSFSSPAATAAPNPAADEQISALENFKMDPNAASSAGGGFWGKSLAMNKKPSFYGG